jgi:hypothetical protein
MGATLIHTHPKKTSTFSLEESPARPFAVGWESLGNGDLTLRCPAMLCKAYAQIWEGGIDLLVIFYVAHLPWLILDLL